MKDTIKHDSATDFFLPLSRYIWFFFSNHFDPNIESSLASYFGNSKKMLAYAETKKKKKRRCRFAAIKIKGGQMISQRSAIVARSCCKNIFKLNEKWILWMKRKRQRIFIQIVVVVAIVVVSRFVTIWHSTHFIRTGFTIAACLFMHVFLRLCMFVYFSLTGIFACESNKHTLTSLWHSVSYLHVERHCEFHLNNIYIVSRFR